MLALLLSVLFSTAPAPALDLTTMEPKEAAALVGRMALHPVPGDEALLLPLLRSGDAGLKRLALRALGFIGNPAVLAEVHPLAADPDAGVRIGYLFAVLRLNGSDEAGPVGALLADPDPRVRLAAQAAATRLGPGDYRGELRAALAGKDLGLAQIAAPALARLGEAAPVAALLGHPMDEARNIAAQGLLDAAPDAAVLDALFAAMERETFGYVTAQLVQTAAYLGRRDVPALVARLVPARNKALLLADLKPYPEYPEIVRASVAALTPASPRAADAVKLLGMMEGTEARDALRRFALGTASPGAQRAAAVRALAERGDAGFIGPMRALAGDPDPALAANAVFGLGLLNDRASEGLVLGALDHAAPLVRKAALASVLRLGLKAAVPAVERLASDPDPQVRQQAAQTLRALNKEAAMNDPLFRLGHDAFLVQVGGKNIYFDPFQLPDGLPKADVILVTHDHHDHLSPDDIRKIATPRTALVLPRAFSAKAAGLPGRVTAVAAGETATVEGLEVRAVPAYNPAKKFHPRPYGGVGYFVTIGGTTYYHAGDTDLTPEMKEFPPADICFLPVSGTYVMTAREAAEATKVLKCRKAVPMHYGAIIGSDGDAEEFKKLAACLVEVLPKTEKIP